MAEEKDLNFIQDIQDMMFGLGDCPKPLEASAEVIQEIVLKQLSLIICKAEDVSQKRNSRIISPQDLIFLMRKDILKLQRLINYLALKDQKNIFQNGLSFTNNGDINVDNSSYIVSMQSNRSQICISYLKELGIDISSNPSKQLHDPIKVRRQQRADWISKKLPTKLYTEYSKSRQVSFYGRFKKSQKFLDWISAKHGENIIPKLKPSTYDILIYLAKETIAQILDLVFVLRQDKIASAGTFHKDTLQNVCVSSSTKNSTSNSYESMVPVTPEEIREAVRRYWSNQLNPFSLFSRTCQRSIDSKIIVF